MAAPNSIICIDNNEITINFSGQALTEGTFISVVQTIPPTSADVYTCVEITGADDPTSGPIYTATSETYSSCYECLVNNNTVVELIDCATGLITLSVDISQIGYSPSTGDILNINITKPAGIDPEVTYIDCFTINSVTQYSQDDYDNLELSIINEIIFSNYTTCDECLYGFSSGTESTICISCCPCTTGETLTNVSAPHPTWTNTQGQAVVQLNAITLGGPNGLNN